MFSVEKIKPQVSVIKGSNFTISMQFAFSRQKGWRLWKQGRNKPTSDDHSIKGQKATLKECFELQYIKNWDVLSLNRNFPQKMFFTAEYCHQYRKKKKPICRFLLLTP